MILIIAGLVVDYPNSTKAKKYYLCLFAGISHKVSLPKALEDSTLDGINYSQKRVKERSKVSRKSIKDKNWVLKKKEARRKAGKPTANDSTFTARKRRVKF